MADTILTARLSKPQFVAKNELNNVTIWQGMAVVDVDVNSPAAVTDFPLVIDGPKDAPTTSQINENDLQAVKIIQPARLRVTAVIADLSMVESIISLFMDPTVTISVTTKSIITDHLVMVDIDLQQSADMVSASKLVMNFEQARAPLSAGFQPEQAADSSMYGVNIKQPEQVSYAGSLNRIISEALTRPPAPLPPGVLLDSDGGPFILNRSKLG